MFQISFVLKIMAVILTVPVTGTIDLTPIDNTDGEWVAFILDGNVSCFQLDNPQSCRQPVHIGEAVACTFDPQGHYRDPVLCFTTHFLGSDIFVTGLFSDDVFLLLPEYSEARINGPVISPDGQNIACVNFDGPWMV